MREKFCRLLMRAFQQNVATIYISRNGTIMFEKINRFRCKKMQLQSYFTKEEILQLMDYIKSTSQVERYGIKPCDYNVVVDGYSVRLDICCIPSMYFECLVLRIIRYNCTKRNRSNVKVKYMS